MFPKIAEITSEETIPIRHEVMWPNKPIDYVRVPNDDKGKHFGLFINDKLIAVISLFVENDEAQFRKFACLVEYQGKGYGTLLLKHVINMANQNKLNKIWCNARIDKAYYYAKFGMARTNEEFVKGGIEYVIMEKTFD